MAKMFAPLYSLQAHGWFGRTTYRRIGLVPNPYPIGIRMPFLTRSVYYSPTGWYYQRRRTWHGTITSAHRVTLAEQPRTSYQQAVKHVMAEAMVGWQALTQQEKDVYYNAKYPLRMHGHNRYIREYMRAKMREFCAWADSNGTWSSNSCRWGGARRATWDDSISEWADTKYLWG